MLVDGGEGPQRQDSFEGINIGEQHGDRVYVLLGQDAHRTVNVLIPYLHGARCGMHAEADE